MSLLSELDGERWIVGWARLEKYTGQSSHMLRRWIGYYDFPKPVLIRKGSRSPTAWSENEVLDWIGARINRQDNRDPHLLPHTIARLKKVVEWANQI